jgi:AAHS family 4-hydroxybenzoate transporter-like MFS transporter
LSSQTTNTTTPRSVDVDAVIDSANYFRLPLAITLMMIVIMLTDGFDLFTMGYVAPHLLKDLGLERPALGPVNMAGLAGMALGSVLLGWLGDRAGRQRAYFTCLAFLFAGSLASYFAQGITALTCARLITGIGLGGITPLGTTLISEWTPRRVRSVVVACVIVSIPLGGTLCGIVARQVIPEYGWRAMFLIGAAAPLVLLVAFGALLPESPKFLAQRPQYRAKLARALNRLVGERRFDGTEEFRIHSPPRPAAHWFAALWSAEFRVTTALIWMVFLSNTFVLYVFTNYLPTLLDFADRNAETASRSLEMFSFGGAFGAIGGAFLIGFFGSRVVGTLLALLGAVAIALAGVLLGGAQSSAAPLLAACLVAGAAVNGMQAFIYAVSANAYPIAFRAGAVGAAQTFSRAGGIASAQAAPFYFAMQPTPPIDFFFLFVAGVAMVVVVSFAFIPIHIQRK